MISSLRARWKQPIDHQGRFAFIHIPKTAGVSLQYALFGQRIRNPHLKSMALLREREAGRYPDYYFFAVVRNPWDRMVSIFNYYQNGGNGSWRDRRVGRRMASGSFQDFISGLPSLPEILGRSLYGYVEPMFIPQHHFVYGKGGESLLSFVARFETLQQDFETIRQTVGLQVSLPHANRQDHEPYPSYYQPESREAVARFCQEDIQRFGFAFESGSQSGG